MYRNGKEIICAGLFIAGCLFMASAAEAQPGKTDNPQTGQADRVGDTGSPDLGGEGQHGDAEARASALVVSGNKYFRQGRFQEAVVAYNQALEYHYEPGYEYNLALVYQRLGRHVLAYKHFTHSLTGAGQPLTETERERAKEFLDGLKAHVGEIDISCGQSGVTVLVDGRPIELDESGRAREIVGIGERYVVASKPGYMPSNEVVWVDAGQTTQYKIQLKDIRSPDVDSSVGALELELQKVREERDRAVQLVRQKHEPRGGRKREMGIALMIAGGVAAGTGVGYGWIASRANRRARRLVELGEWESPVSEVVDDIGEGGNLGVLIGGIAGTGLLSTGAVLYWLGERESRAMNRRLEKQISVMPHASETAVGIQVRGTF